MALIYHTQLLTSFFDKFVELLSKDGENRVVLYNGNNESLVTCPLSNQDIVLNRTDTTLQLVASSSAIATLDGTATKGAILNGDGVKLVEFDVGSQMINPLAELILNSVVIYKGGTVTINSITLTV